MKKDIRNKLIHQAATIEADGVKWRNRLERWMKLKENQPRKPRFPGVLFGLDLQPLRFAL